LAEVPILFSKSQVALAGFEVVVAGSILSRKLIWVRAATRFSVMPVAASSLSQTHRLRALKRRRVKVLILLTVASFGSEVSLILRSALSSARLERWPRGPTFTTPSAFVASQLRRDGLHPDGHRLAEPKPAGRRLVFSFEQTASGSLL
jgi:hypothetical protein